MFENYLVHFQYIYGIKKYRTVFLALPRKTNKFIQYSYVREDNDYLKWVCQYGQFQL